MLKKMVLFFAILVLHAYVYSGDVLSRAEMGKVVGKCVSGCHSKVMAMPGCKDIGSVSDCKGCYNCSSYQSGGLQVLVLCNFVPPENDATCQKIGDVECYTKIICTQEAVRGYECVSTHGCKSKEGDTCYECTPHIQPPFKLPWYGCY